MTTPDPADYAPLFDPFSFAGLELANRIVMAPMTRRLSPDNRVPGEDTARYYARRAAGGVGLILTEGVHIDPVHAPDSENVPGLFNGAQTEGWSRVAGAVHAAGGKIGAQLWHTGRHAMNPIGPSAVPVINSRTGEPKATPRAMTAADLDQVTEAFASAAVRAKHAGLDTVEIHGAHGYLLDSFLLPTANTRDDAFGGSLENRQRFPLQVAKAVRDAVGPGYPVLYRLSQWSMEDYAQLAYPDAETLGNFIRKLAEAGVDAVHVSTRDLTDAAFPDSEETLASAAKRLGGLPSVAVGRVSVSTSMSEDAPLGVTDPKPAADQLAEGLVDLVAVGRALIANPDWPELVRQGRWAELSAYDRTMLDSLEDDHLPPERLAAV